MKLEYEVDDGIGTITLSDPPKNTLRGPAFADRAVLESFLSREDLKGVVIRGAGRHFSAGADLDELRRRRADERSLESLAKELEEGKAALEAITFAPVPVVAMIKGSCLGAGLEIAMAAHFRIASENALLGYPESGLGLIPGLGGTATTPEVLPRRVAIDLILSGRMLSAEEALETGLVDRVVPTSDLPSTTRGFLTNLVARRSPMIIHAIMTAIHNARRLPREEALREEGRLFLEVARATSLSGGDGGERN